MPARRRGFRGFRRAPLYHLVVRVPKRCTADESRRLSGWESAVSKRSNRGVGGRPLHPNRSALFELLAVAKLTLARKAHDLL